MAAAYSTGASTSPSNLIQTLATWLATQGWTLDYGAAVGISGYRIHMHKGAVYLHAYAFVTENVDGVYTVTGTGIGLYLSDGYTGSGTAWNRQQNYPVLNGVAGCAAAYTQLPSGTVIAYHFFDDGSDNITVCVNKDNTYWTAFGFGALTKFGTWTGGQFYFGGTSPNRMGSTSTSYSGTSAQNSAPPMSEGSAYVRADVGTFTGQTKWLCNERDTTSTAEGYTGKRFHPSYNPQLAIAAGGHGYPVVDYNIQAQLTSASNSRSLLHPQDVWAVQDSGRYSLIGRVPGMYGTDLILRGTTVGSVVSVNGSNYFVMPGMLGRASWMIYKGA